MRPYRARFRGQGVFFAFQSWAGCITNIFGFDLRQAQGEALERWRGAIISVAVQEMGHLLIVANPTVAVGGRLFPVLFSYMSYYNGTRTHLSLIKDAPMSRVAETAGRILCRPDSGRTAPSIYPNLIGGKHSHFIPECPECNEQLLLGGVYADEKVN